MASSAAGVSSAVTESTGSQGYLAEVEVAQEQVAEVDRDVDRLVIVSDLHAVRESLEVLNRHLDALSDGAQVLCCGDVVAAGIDPVEAVTWVRRRAGTLAVRGNHDRLPDHPQQGDHPPDSEPGSAMALGAELLGYLTGLPDQLVVEWRGKRIRIIHGDFTPAGEEFCYVSTPEEGVAAFAEPALDATVYGHTHFPFVHRGADFVVANPGSASMTMLRFITEDGTEHWQSGDPHSAANDDPRPSYLCITEEAGTLEFEIVRFDYDRPATVGRLAAEPVLMLRIERMRPLLLSGTFDRRL